MTANLTSEQITELTQALEARISLLKCDISLLGDTDPEAVKSRWRLIAICEGLLYMLSS